MNLLLAISAVATLQAMGIAGGVPAGVGSLQPPGDVVWLPAGPTPDQAARTCELVSSTRWVCRSAPLGESGVVLIGADEAVGYVLVGPAGATLSGTAAWGRLVRVAANAVDVPPDLRASTWVVDRPASRPNTRRLDLVRDDSVDVVRLSDTAFWVSGRWPSADAFLRVEGSGGARQDIRMLTIAEAPTDSAYVIQLPAAVSISGRVETRSGEPVSGALVELFARAPGAEDQPAEERGRDTGPVLRLESTRADDDGRFEFGGLAHGAYEVVATSFSSGRLSRWTTTTNPPLVMRLVPPAIVTGRVVRQKLPAADVRVRFVPDSTAWRKSTDPTAHLSTETRTSTDGRFVLALPPEAAGDVQFIAPDGASLRRALPAMRNLTEIALGDVALSELIAVAVRADVPGCRMTAVGPTGALGLAIVAARATSTLYQFELPEPGEWFLDAECDGQHVWLQPPAVQLKAGSSVSLDVHVVFAAGTSSR